MIKKTSKQKVWNNHKNSLYGRSRLRLNKKGKRVHVISTINSGIISDESSSWIKPVNMGV